MSFSWNKTWRNYKFAWNSCIVSFWISLQSDADPIETADFDFHSSHSSRRASVVQAQMLLLRIRHGLHSSVHFMGGSILAAGNSLINWWKRKTRSDEESNTFYMGDNQFRYYKGEEEQLLLWHSSCLSAYMDYLWTLFKRRMSAIWTDLKGYILLNKP